jgi:phosphatidylinositol alpha 1,6-mannosyltransferase
LLAAGVENFEIHVVGHGGETEFLQQNLKHGVFPGVVKGEDLARVYANFDAFLFPSRTDTFGNVILEALASGVPAIVTDGGGPKYLVDDGKTGFVTTSDRSFVEAALRIALEPGILESMRVEARLYAAKQSWDSVFNDVYRAYECALQTAAAA